MWVTQTLPLYHANLTIPPSLSSLVHVHVAHRCSICLRRKSLSFGLSEALAAYWGGILKEQLQQIVLYWLLCLGWWWSDPAEMDDLSLSKPLSMIPVNPGPGLSFLLLFVTSSIKGL